MSIAGDVAWTSTDSRVIAMDLTDPGAVPLVLEASAAVIWSEIAEDGPLAGHELLNRLSAVFGKDADEIRKGPKHVEKPVIGPSKWMYWNVHIDGLERTHDLIVEREGVFQEAVLAMRMAKLLGRELDGKDE